MGRYEKALAVTLRVYKATNDPYIQENVALCYYGLGNYDEALRQASAALKTDSTLIWAKLIIALASEKKLDFTNALKYYKLYLAVDPIQEFSKQYIHMDVHNKIKSLEQ
jgi:tetratricopeptide (TPR) repeat protein